ncbi:type IV toxin-antitoxin system YeeU family antitoxin [Enterobacter sp. ENT02]|uniref:type IV toxin-antitoxin system YeeU family antitoxin n=1 Tax=Enterobacter sp. ENT02 TaxID=2854767 RepID=UPI001C470046|nr:type IV toxin-antitoxin system YeeU family antitoxin [Enterobacter sp. ENT02]MBV7560083.1 type IV toxin-antitoxin system YeeU family antitoxin [Enterobacter sp. ENT02]
MTKEPVQEHVWGLHSQTVPSLSARLVQEGRRLHFLADRATLLGAFSPEQSAALDAVFPAFIRDMEIALLSGKLTPREVRQYTCSRNGFTCESDTQGSCGYVYIVIYICSSQNVFS